MKQSEHIIQGIKNDLDTIIGRDNKIKYLEQYRIKLEYHGTIPENGKLPEYDVLDNIDYGARDEICRWIQDTISRPEIFDSHPLPASMTNHLQALLKHDILISYDKKPNFKKLSTAVCFFDLFHDKYDIPDYNYKIIADNILVKGQMVTQENINTTRSRGRGNERQKDAIIKILPDLE